MMRSASSRPDGAAQLDRLRAKIRAIEPRALGTPAGGHSSPETAMQLQPGLHEFCPADYLDTPAALAVQAGFMATHLDGTEQHPPLVWVRLAGDRSQDFGAPYPLGLKQWGLSPEQILLAEAQDMGDALWAMEEALRAGAWLIGEVGQAPQYNLTRSKRLSLAARKRGGLALILRSHLAVSPSAALSRWRISARASHARAWRGATGLPGLGHPTFRAQLERVRGGPPADFDIEWKNAAFHVLKPAALANRPADDVPAGRPVAAPVRHIA